MFYAHTEGRRWGLLRAMANGLSASTFNIMYPPSVDEVEATKRKNFDIAVNPQSFRLPYPPSTWSPRIAEFLSDFGTVTAHDMADFDEYEVPRELNDRGEEVCDNLARLQREFGASEYIAPYFYAADPDDPYFELSILCGQYLADQLGDRVVFTGVMMDGAVFNSAVKFDKLANRVTSPDAAQFFYFDFDLGSPKGRPLRDPELLNRLKSLFDAAGAAEKYTLLARCNLEGLLLRATSGLDAFSSSYYQSERQALHRTLQNDYQESDIKRPPTPYLFSRRLMTDIPRDVAQALIAANHKRWLVCDCQACADVVRTNFGSGAGGLCPIHYYISMSDLDKELERYDDIDDRTGLMLEWLETAEQSSASVVAKAGTFTHLRRWREWIESLT